MLHNLALRDVAAFVRVLELGSFKAAAHDLNVTPSALTQRIQRLEDAIGARLVDRTTRSVAPTAIGQSFLPAAARLLAQFDRSVADLRDLVEARAGRIAIASLISIATYVLPAALARFAAAHPGVGVRVLDDAERALAEYVRRGDAEFALDMQTPELDADPDLKQTPFMADRFVLACPAGHPLAAGGPAEWAELDGQPLVTLGPRTGTSRLLTQYLAKAGRPLAWRYEVQHLSTMIGFIEAGVAIGIAPALALRTGPGARLASRPLAGPDFTRTIALIERRSATLSPSAARLKGMLLEGAGRGNTKDGSNREPHVDAPPSAVSSIA